MSAAPSSAVAAPGLPALRGAARASALAWLGVLAALVAAGSVAVGGPEHARRALADVHATDPVREGPTEYEVKASCLRLFAKYTTWPAKVFERKDSPIVFAVVGEDPFGRRLDAALRGERVGGRKLVARRFSRVKDIEGPVHVLFIGDMQRGARKQLLEEWSGRPVLIVADEPGLTEQGVVLGFYLKEERVRFEASTENARAAHLELSSQLLRHARIVD